MFVCLFVCMNAVCDDAAARGRAGCFLISRDWQLSNQLNWCAGVRRFGSARFCSERKLGLGGNHVMTVRTVAASERSARSREHSLSAAEREGRSGFMSSRSRGFQIKMLLLSFRFDSVRGLWFKETDRRGEEGGCVWAGSWTPWPDLRN